MQLIKGDCLQEMKKLESESIDMLLTDPPYGMSFQSNHRKEKYDGIQNDNSLIWLDDFVSESYRLMKNNTAGYVFCSFHHIDKFKAALEKKFKIKNVLVWEKNNTSMGDLKADFAPKIEFIIFIQKGRRMIEGKRDPNIFKFARTGNKHHPTEKPVDLLEYLISKFSSTLDVILDPFMGSGSTAIASRNKGRDFIGIEIDEVHFKTANDRLNLL